MFDEANTAKAKLKKQSKKTNQELYFQYLMNNNSNEEGNYRNVDNFYDDKSRFKYYRARTSKELEEGYAESEVSTEPPGSPGGRNFGFIEEPEDDVKTPDSPIIRIKPLPPPGMRITDIGEKNIAELLKNNNESEQSIRINIGGEDSNEFERIRNNGSIEL